MLFEYQLKMVRLCRLLSYKRNGISHDSLSKVLSPLLESFTCLSSLLTFSRSSHQNRRTLLLPFIKGYQLAVHLPLTMSQYYVSNQTGYFPDQYGQARQYSQTDQSGYYYGNEQAGYSGGGHSHLAANDIDNNSLHNDTGR